MKIYLTDETNAHRNPLLGFFIYGGIVVDETELKPLSQGVLDIKSKYGVPKERPIKWPNKNWSEGEEIPSGTHIAVKDALIDLFAASSAKIIVCLSPQDFYIVRKFIGYEIQRVLDVEKQKRTQKYAMNDVLKKFDQFLDEDSSLGMVLADDFPENMKAHLTEHCFAIFPTGTSASLLQNIAYPVLQVSNEYSQLHQLNDVILGAIGHSLKEMAAPNLLPKLKDHFWAGEPGNIMSILGRGFNTYPLLPQVPRLQEDLGALRDKFIVRLQA